MQKCKEMNMFLIFFKKKKKGRAVFQQWSFSATKLKENVLLEMF